LPNSRRRPLYGPSCGSHLSKKDPLFCLQKGGRFAPVVAVPHCPKRPIILPSNGGRFAPVVVVICSHFAAVVVLPNCCPIPEGSRFAALVVVPIILPSKRRPFRGPSCGSQLSKRDPLICLQEDGRFAPVVVVICCLQKDAPVVDVIYSLQKGGRFAPVVVVICCLQKNKRPLRARSCCYL
jgi:hypothetical protein